MRTVDTRPPEVEYIVGTGQRYWQEIRDPSGRDLTGLEIDAVLLQSWNDRTPVDGQTVEVRGTAEQRAEGIFFVGSNSWLHSGVVLVGIAVAAEAPVNDEIALRFTVRTGGGRQ